MESDQPTTVCQDIVIPTLQFMCSSDLVQDSLARLEAQMICIVET
jgi:hypothetical protein